MEYIFVPMNASWQEESWLADCGKGCDCGTVHKIIMKKISINKKMRHEQAILLV